MTKLRIVYVLLLVVLIESNIIPNKPQFDNKNYRVIQLANNLTFILVSDPNTEKAAASIDVHVGHFSDPEEVPGLAHFLEHMLFLGTGKYPEENGFGQYLSAHAGSSNAYTAMEHTNYYFDVDSNYLQVSLDMFSRFFIDPLFNENSTFREMNAVDSEHKKNLQSDLWRVQQVIESTSNPNHPYHKFGTGDIDTLFNIPNEHSIDIRKELFKFHDKYYSSNIMKGAIVGKESLDVLEELVVKLFSNITNKNTQVPQWAETPFNDINLKKHIKIVPVQEIKDLKLLFPIPAQKQYWKQKPIYFLSQLIGHEVPGTLAHTLKKNGLITTISSGVFDEGEGFAIFVIEMELTESGVDNIEKIVEMTFEYINLVKDKGIEKWRYDEFSILANISFQYYEPVPPVDYAPELSALLQKFPPINVLDGSFTMSDFDSTLINTMISCLNPDNLTIVSISQTYEKIANLSEPWYHTKYTMNKIDQNLIDLWKNQTQKYNFALPSKNIFIPTNFTIKEKDTENSVIPKLVVNTENKMKAWFLQDNIFKLPKANIYINMYTPVAYLTPLSSLLTQVYINMATVQANEVLYDAQLASLDYGFELTPRGIEVFISGFNEKQLDLATKLFEIISGNYFDYDVNRFNVILSQIEDNFYNAEFLDPYKQARELLTSTIVHPIWREEDYLNVIQFVTLDALKIHVQRLNSEVSFDIFAHGNLVKSDVEKLSKVILDNYKNSIGIPNDQVTYQRMVKFNPGKQYLTLKNASDNEPNSAIITYYQTGVSSLKDTIIIHLLHTILHDKFFEKLRTIEQLGYIVGSSNVEKLSVGGFGFVIQSSVKDPFYLDSRIENFLNGWKDELSKMPSDVFKSYIEATKTLLTEKPKVLSDLTDLYWDQITTQLFIFNITDIVSSKIDQLTIDDLKAFCELYFFNNKTRSKLSVQIFGYDHVDSQLENNYKYYTLIKDITNFKKSSNLYSRANAVQYLIDRVLPYNPQNDTQTKTTTQTSTSSTSSTSTSTSESSKSSSSSDTKATSETSTSSESKSTSTSSTDTKSSDSKSNTLTFTDDNTSSGHSDDSNENPECNKKYSFSDMVFVVLITALVVILMGSVIVVVIVKYYIKKASNNDLYGMEGFDELLNDNK